MTTETHPESNDLNELNEDATGTVGLFKILSLFANPAMQQGNEEDSNSYFSINQFQPLTPQELNTIFRSSFLARKIIEKYPQEAKNFGYVVQTKDGKILQKNDSLVLECIYEASIWSRLYGHCYLILEYENTLPQEPVKPGEKLIKYIIEFSLIKEGDFFKKSDNEVFHYTKVQLFHGRKTYIPYITPYEENYADSIYQSLIITLRNYVSSNETTRKILSNISYLLLGIKNLGNMTKTDRGREEVYMRLESIRTNRNVNRTITYDKENEILSYITQATNGIKELVSNIKEIFVAESDYPAEQLFEESSNQSIGNGIANQLIARFLWAKRSHSYAETSFLPQYKTFFDRHYPEQDVLVIVPFKMVLTQSEKAELEKFASERTKNLIESKVIAPEEARSGYRTDEFDLGIILDDNLYKQMVEASKDTGDVANDKVLNSETDNTRTTTLEGDKNLDAVFNPDDQSWDILSTITLEDLENVMEGALNAGTK